MRSLRYLLPAAATLFAALVVVSTESRAFNVLGFNLGLGVRDVRVFNNFSAVASNDNTTADADWSGVTGAPLAIWKGCAEWSSELHSLTGNGDPHQPGGVGSGGANFDSTWQGRTTSVGGIGDRVHSELSGSNGGVLAFTEGPNGAGGPDATGWRIRYYSVWAWDDGPSTPIAGSMDLQGVACHEYGHALGLAHTSVSGSTMYAVVANNGTTLRSIESDDQLGVQSIYAALDGLVKPHIASYSVTNNVLTVVGANFDATANELWFTRAFPATSGVPIKVTGLASNGTVISAAIPLGVGPGDVLVRKTATSGGKALSNAFAFDPNAWICVAPVVYCTTSLTSNFCNPRISCNGYPSASASAGFVLRCDDMEGQLNALFFHGVNGRVALPWAVNSSSWMCVKSPLQRTPLANPGGTSGLCNGTISLDWLAYMASNPLALGNPLQAGASFDAQCWFRDPAAPKTTNLSDALEFTLCP